MQILKNLTAAVFGMLALTASALAHTADSDLVAGVGIRMECDAPFATEVATTKARDLAKQNLFAQCQHRGEYLNEDSIQYDVTCGDVDTDKFVDDSNSPVQCWYGVHTGKRCVARATGSCLMQ